MCICRCQNFLSCNYLHATWKPTFVCFVVQATISCNEVTTFLSLCSFVCLKRINPLNWYDALTKFWQCGLVGLVCDLFFSSLLIKKFQWTQASSYPCIWIAFLLYAIKHTLTSNCTICCSIFRIKSNGITLKCHTWTLPV